MKRILSLVLVLAMLASTALVLSACDWGYKPDESLKGQYTYNTYASEFPDTWNPHTYQTATDSVILDYTSVGFLTFDYNETKDGYVIVPEMAAGMPEDVTADYVGDEWDIMEDDTARAWKITLRSDLKWEDGTPITAHDFVTSAQLLLNPDSNNYRADSLYSGNMEIMGAKDYYYGGKTVQFDNFDGSAFVVTMDGLTKGDDGVYVDANGLPVYIAVKESLTWLGGVNSIYDYVNAYGADMFDVDAFNAILEVTNEDTGLAPLTDDTYANLVKVITYSPDWGETEDNAPCYFYYSEECPRTEYDTVGIKALSDTELVLILESELSGFYLHYSLTGSWLVHEETYRACETIKDGIYNNTYGTSKETFMSYGPYKIESYEPDKQWVLVKNENWYGHNDHPELYQTSRVVCDWIAKPETAMLMFLQGKLDSKGLDANQSGEYLGSEHLYHSEGESTWFMAMNPSESAFAKWEAANPGNKDKSILAIKEFRMALSFSLDRTAFVATCDPTGAVAYGVFGNMICANPETGEMYRNTEDAKNTLLSFWGISLDDIGAGKKFASKEEAIDSITGYNLAAAKELFDIAYDKVIEAGLMDESDEVLINIGTPNSTTAFYVKGYEFLKNNYTKAVEGTKLEGKLKFENTNTLGNGFADALRANTVDLLFGVGWSGSALDPYSLIEAYTTKQYQYDPSWNTGTSSMIFNIDGVDYTASVLTWTEIINGNTREIAVAGEDGLATDETRDYSCGLNDGEPETRLRLLSALENAVLQTYDMIPVNADAGVSLKGMQIQYYTEEEVYGLGRGGIKYMTYNYDDYEWDAYVHSCGGTLNYK